jgi:predicted Rossmann fold nucleotide-binding protein DprA/Smf involved in DNA uptake
MNHPELDFARYPDVPGYKNRGTSKAAADSMREKAPTLRQKVLDVLFHQNLTADECAAEVGKSLLSIRPRLTELLALGKIADTGETRTNDSGKKATVWRAV